MVEDPGPRFAPRLSFVIPVRNDAEGLRRCLRAISDGSPPGDRSEVIVADNGSTDASPAVAREMGATVLDLPGCSIAALRNEAARHARGEILAFVDADQEIASDWERAAIETLSENGVAAAGAPYAPPPAPTWVQRTYDWLREPARGRCPALWLPSGNMAVVRSYFEEVGGFDESIVTCEDVDLCRRLRNGGHRIVNEPRMRSIHYGDPATLREVFARELWRGQDNLRVTLRSRPALVEIPSVLIPVVFLISIVLVVGGLLVSPWIGGAGIVAGLVLVAAIVVFRTSRMIANAPSVTSGDVLRTLAVSAVYEAARALALVVRIPHRRAALRPS